jgi:hypothetical protein
VYCGPGKFEIGIAVQQPGYGHLPFQPCEGHANATVDAGRKGEMRVGLPLNVESFRLVEPCRVPVRSANA